MPLIPQAHDSPVSLFGHLAKRIVRIYGDGVIDHFQQRQVVMGVAIEPRIIEGALLPFQPRFQAGDFAFPVAGHTRHAGFTLSSRPLACSSRHAFSPASYSADASLSLWGAAATASPAAAPTAAAMLAVLAAKLLTGAPLAAAGTAAVLIRPAAIGHDGKRRYLNP